MKQNGFSLMEVVVSSVVFSIAVVGVFSTIGSVQQPVATTEKTLQGVYCGQQVMETLRARVDSRDWNSGSLSLGTHTLTAAAGELAPYAACAGFSRLDYTVYNAANGSRRVVTTVSW